MSLGSLEPRSLGLLGDLGILPTQDVEEEINELQGKGLQSGPQSGNVTGPSQDGSVERDIPTTISSEHEQLTLGKPWVEEIIEGSPLGRMKRRRGGRASLDGTIKVEWEILEFDGDEFASPSEGDGNGNRKIGEVAGEDVDMSARR